LALQEKCGLRLLLGSPTCCLLNYGGTGAAQLQPLHSGQHAWLQQLRTAMMVRGSSILAWWLKLAGIPKERRTSVALAVLAVCCQFTLKLKCQWWHI
jgi:hypothetical protein